MIQIFQIILVNGEKSQPIECSRIIPIEKLNRFRLLIQTFARARSKSNVNVLLNYKNLEQ